MTTIDQLSNSTETEGRTQMESGPPDWRADLALSIEHARQSGKKMIQTKKSVAALLVRGLADHGQFFRDGHRTFYFDREARQTIEIDGGDLRFSTHAFDVRPLSAG